MFVMMPMSGRTIRSSDCISPLREIPASITAICSSPAVISSDSGTPICEL